MQWKQATAAGVLEVLAFTTVIDADALNALLLNKVIHTQLAEFFKSCTCNSPKERQPVAPWILAGLCFEYI
ncbi:hypothetical protein D3C84_807470 [compost metagenome]